MSYTFPYISKITSDSVIYDSLGNINQKYNSLYYDKNYIYFLIDNTGKCVKFNTITESYEDVDIIKVNATSINSIIEFKKQIYGFEGDKATKFIDNSVLYIKDSNKLVQEYFDTNINSKIIHLSSASIIKDFFIDEDFNYYVLHDFSKLSKFTKERIPIYSIEIKNTNTTAFYDIGISTNSIIEFLKMDYVREYTSNGLSSYPIILGRESSNSRLFLIKIDENNLGILGDPNILLDSYGNALSAESLLPFFTENKINYNLTNYEFLKNQYPNKNELLFKLVLKNSFDNKDITYITIPISTKYFKGEKHHFAFRLDAKNGLISVFLDGELIQSQQIYAGQYLFQDILYESMSIGNTYYTNRTSLDEYLKQNGYYYINNLEVEQFKMYNKSLTDNEIRFLLFNNIKVDDLIVSLPSGQRNGIDCVERQFKLDIGGSKSNKFNIIIKNSKLTNKDLQDKMSEIIREKLKKVMPATSTIQNIEYRN